MKHYEYDKETVLNSFYELVKKVDIDDINFELDEMFIVLFQELDLVGEYELTPEFYFEFPDEYHRIDIQEWKDNNLYFVVEGIEYSEPDSTGFVDYKKNEIYAIEICNGEVQNILAFLVKFTENAKRV